MWGWVRQRREVPFPHLCDSAPPTSQAGNQQVAHNPQVGKHRCVSLSRQDNPASIQEVTPSRSGIVVARLTKKNNIKLLVNQLRMLVPHFDDMSRALLAPQADRVVIGELRAWMAHAGDALLQLVLQGAVERPKSMPPWLSLSLRSGRRPRFDSILDHTRIGPCRTVLGSMTLSKMIGEIIDAFEPFDPKERRRRSEVDPAPFRRRHVFLEAVAGWLGSQLGLGLHLRLPTVTIFHERKIGVPETRAHLCLDLMPGKGGEARLFFLDIARACGAASAALVKRLESVSRGHAQAPHSASPPATHPFYELAVSTLRETESIVDFLRARYSHPDWVTLRSKIPLHLTAAEDEFMASRDDAILANHEWTEAQGGKFYNGWIDQARRDREGTLRSLKDRADRAQERLAKATIEHQATHEERRREENAVTAGWLDEHTATFAKRRRVFANELDRYVHSIEALRPDPFEMQDWKDTCACNVLLKIASAVVEQAEIDPTGRDWMDAHALRERIVNISHGGWRDLEIAVRKEAAALAASSKHTAPIESAQRAARRGPQSAPMPTIEDLDSLPSFEPEDRSYDTIKLFVQTEDGRSLGGFFKDGAWHKHRWHGAPSLHRQEDMVCAGDQETGAWFLILYVLPRVITGSALNDSLIDTASVACRRTPVQALAWFAQQAFGPPPALVERVRLFVARWGQFCTSPSARAMLASLTEKFFDGDDVMFTGPGKVDLELLESLGLLCVASGSPQSYKAMSIVEEMTVEGFIAWMNGHISQVSGSLIVADRGHLRTSNADIQDALPPQVAPPPTPRLRAEQLPAKVLVTLLANNGQMRKRALHRVHRSGKTDPRLANLLTPKGELADSDLIRLDGDTVTLTPTGRMEATLQSSLGTATLGSDDSRLTHGDSQ